jgi:hypothetical protein
MAAVPEFLMTVDIGRLAVQRAVFGHIRIEELEVGRLRVSQLEVEEERRSSA